MEDETPVVETEFDTRAPADVALDVTPDEEPDPELPEEDGADDSNDAADEPEAPEAPETPEEEPYKPPQKIKVDVPTFEGEVPVDEYGNIDAAKLGEYLQARDKHILDAARAESANTLYDNLYVQREWADVSEKYPDLAKDETLRGMVDNLRYADAIKGGEGSLMEAAKQIEALRQSSVEAGLAKGQKNTTRQKSVATTGAPRVSGKSEAAKLTQLRKQAANGNDEARIRLLADLYDSGALN